MAWVHVFLLASSWFLVSLGLFNPFIYKKVKYTIHVLAYSFCQKKKVLAYSSMLVHHIKIKIWYVILAYLPCLAPHALKVQKMHHIS